MLYDQIKLFVFWWTIAMVLGVILVSIVIPMGQREKEDVHVPLWYVPLTAIVFYVFWWLFCIIELKRIYDEKN